MKQFVTCALVILALLQTAPAKAVEPTPTDALVWAINAWDGRVYQTTFAPPASKDLYLMAGEPATLRLAATRIYYWPLSRQFVATWLNRDETVSGTLEVWQGNRRVASLEPEPFVIQAPSGELHAETDLYTGDAAVAMFEEYMAAHRRYNEALRAYNEAVANLSPEQEAPAQPTPPLTASTNPAIGFAVNLPEGRYVLKVLGPNGSYIPEAERNLTVFGVRRQGVGYMVLPEERWTEPETAANPADVLYSTGGRTLYLVPHHALEVPDQAYERMLNPQSRGGQADQWRWVLTNQIQGQDLTLASPQGTASVAVQPYRVEQVGGTLGYRVIEAEDTATATFNGYRINLPPNFDRVTLSLPSDPTAGRQIREVRSSFPWLLDAAVVSLSLGAVVITLYRRFRSPLRAD